MDQGREEEERREKRKEKKKVSGRCEEEEGKGRRRGVPVRSMSAGDLRQASLEKSKERERDGGMTGYSNKIGCIWHSIYRAY